MEDFFVFTFLRVFYANFSWAEYTFMLIMLLACLSVIPIGIKKHSQNDSRALNRKEWPKRPGT